jgi:signal recognition particle subunit SRP19
MCSSQLLCQIRDRPLILSVIIHINQLRLIIVTSLKDYDHSILWLDYFNKNLSRSKGRKVTRDLAIFDPSMTDLIEAAKALGYNLVSEEINDNCRYPKRPFVKSGNIMVVKQGGKNKSSIIRAVAEKMSSKKKRDR